MRKSQQKLKRLYLLKILTERTDEEHTITVPEMITALEEYGIFAERKSIYDDIECLRLFGVDICSRKSRTTDYYVDCREFELPELKLLVDSVQASKFITTKKSMELISKIEKLTSNANAKKLQRQVFILNRVKTLNEQVFYNIDKIHDAISANRKITFKYFDFDVNKQKVYRKNGELYTETPVSLIWDDENYYLIAYKEKYNSFTHYRVDKMEYINITEQERTLPDKNFDPSEYTKSVFSMFGGEETEVTILFENELMNVVFDRFGTGIPISVVDENHFSCRVKVAVSPVFLSWVTSFGNRAKIVAPENVVVQLKDMLNEVIENYK